MQIKLNQVLNLHQTTEPFQFSVTVIIDSTSHLLCFYRDPMLKEITWYVRDDDPISKDELHAIEAAVSAWFDRKHL